MREAGRSQQRRVLAVASLSALLLLAGLPAVALPTPTGPFVAHAPITITSDAAFTAANGVTSGTGTPADPFIISGWSFSTSGTAIVVSNVTANFTIRNNSFAAQVGVYFNQSATVGVIQNNQFLVRGTGVIVANADAHILDNSFSGNPAYGATARGVQLIASSSRVESNAFLYLQYGVYAERGSPSIVCNDVHDDVFVAGFYVAFTTNATIACNIITQCTLAMRIYTTIGTIIVNNSVNSCAGGVEVVLSKDVTIANNTLRLTTRAQVSLDVSSGNVTGNVIVDGRAEGIVLVNSPMLVANNTVHNHLGIGIKIVSAGPDVTANVVTYNNVGISLQAGAVARLTANVMMNNTVGLDIPYSSRQAIVNMSANVVNGINVDGTLVASEQVYFYHAANVQIVGQVRDSGFSAGFFGSVTAQGSVVLYEVMEAHIESTIMSHANFGVTAINSFNVVVESSVVTNTQIGVYAANVTTGFQVPPCAVSVKNTTINISVDPFGTIGVDAHGCLVNVLNASISVVDTGVRLDTMSWGNVSGNVVTNTLVGLEVTGIPGFVTITANVVSNNRIGARFVGSHAVVSDNTFEGNTVAGVYMYANAKLTFERNTVRLNGVGVADAGPCSSGPFMSTCGSLVAQGNVVTQNRGDGVRVNGTSTFKGDAFIGNGGNGARLASATLVNVTASANDGDGASARGTFLVRGSEFVGNAGHGLVIVGSGDLRASNFTFNGGAGVRATATFVTAFQINASFNLDGILFDELIPPDLDGTFGGSEGPDPMDIHVSVIWRNLRDGVRAGAAVVNATHNWWGGDRPAISVADQVGAFQNGVSPTVRFLPYYTDPAMTTTGPVAGL